MKLIITTGLIFSSFAVFGQTKKIHAKSHSGDAYTLEESGNIGMVPTYKSEKSKKPKQTDTTRKEVMIHDSVATYQFILDSTKTKSEQEAKPKAKQKKTNSPEN